VERVVPTPVRIRNAWVCRVGAGPVRPRFGEIHLEGGRVRAIRPCDFARYREAAKVRSDAAAPPPEQPGPRALGSTGSAGGQPARPGPLPPRELDAAGRVVTVPRVNFHEHFYSRLAKGLDLGRPLDSFVHILENFWWAVDRALDPDMVEACARVGALEAVRSGVTVVFDHHACPSCPAGSLDLIAGVLREAELRGVLCYESSDRGGAVEAEAALAENRRFLERGSDAQVRGLVGLHASFTLSDRTLQAAAVLARELETGIHIHLSEDRHDLEACLAAHGASPAERLERFGLLDRPGLLAHGVHLTSRDREVLAASPCALALNPDSNLNNAVGLPEYAALPAALPLVAGTDGMHGDPGRSLKQLFLLSRHQGFSSGDSFRWGQRIAADQERFVRRFFPDHPSLAAGDRADLVVWDYRPPSPLDEGSFWGHYLYGVLESPAWAVLQAGRLLYLAGVHYAQNAESVFAAASRQGQRLFAALRAGKRRALH
jgi:cytosine/adenosine deaminase-related metal-dependent hydrolase